MIARLVVSLGVVAVLLVAGAPLATQAADEPHSMIATVEKIDTSGGKLTVVGGPCVGGKKMTLNITKDTKILIKGKESALKDLQKGWTVMVKYNSKTLEAREIKKP